MISTVSSWKKPAYFFLRLATFPLSRAAILISDHNDALYKTMRYDSIEAEMITVDGEEKAFSDPDNALHHFLGIRFAFADEGDGVLFDPRHAAAGMRKRNIMKRNESSFLATEEEWNEFDISKWMPGVFEMPKKHELVDLSAVSELVDGGERSDYAKSVEEMYKHSQDPFGSGTPALKYLYPILALAITFGGTWFMSSQFGLPGGPNSSVSFGLLALLVSTARIKDLPWKKIAAVFFGVTVPVGLIAAIYVFAGLIMAVGMTLGFALGFLILPVLTVLFQPSEILSGFLSSLYFKLGFFGFRQPVITWTPSKYIIKEYDEMENDGNVDWYDLWGHTIGVSYEPTEESWGPEVIPHSQIEAQQPVADGGKRTKSNLPAKFVRSTQLKYGNYGTYLPKRIRDDHYYLNSKIVMERFNNSADGTTAQSKLREAKEVHGGGQDGIDDSVVFKTSVVTGVLGLFLGLGIFVLPAFL
jgi:hypothetical protein